MADDEEGKLGNAIKAILEKFQKYSSFKSQKMLEGRLHNCHCEYQEPFRKTTKENVPEC